MEGSAGATPSPPTSAQATRPTWSLRMGRVLHAWMSRSTDSACTPDNFVASCESMLQSSSSFLYSIHGLTVSSEFQCADLAPGSGVPDVRIRSGQVPHRLANPRAAGVLFEVDADNYLLRVDGIARYRASLGREVIVEQMPGATSGDVQTFLFGTVFSALLQQRGALVMHAGAFVGPTGAVLVAGNSGCGKSTLLATQSRALLADDAVVITPGEADGLVAQPSVPRLKLWRDAVERLGYPIEGLSQVRCGVEKYALDVAPRFSRTPQPVAGIVVIDVHNQAHVSVEPVENSARFAAVRAHTRNFKVVEGSGTQLRHFQIAAALAACVPIVRVRRPLEGDSLDEVVASVEHILTSWEPSSGSRPIRNLAIPGFALS